MDIYLKEKGPFISSNFLTKSPLGCNVNGGASPRSLIVSHIPFERCTQGVIGRNVVLSANDGSDNNNNKKLKPGGQGL